MSGCGRRFSQEKTFTDSPKTTKFTKVFYLESFPLYGIPSDFYMHRHRVSVLFYTKSSKSL